MFSPITKYSHSGFTFASEITRARILAVFRRTDTSIGKNIQWQYTHLVRKIISLIQHSLAMFLALRQSLVLPECFLPVVFEYFYLCSWNICFPQNSNDVVQVVPIFALTVKILVLLALNHLADSAYFCVAYVICQSSMKYTSLRFWSSFIVQSSEKILGYWATFLNIFVPQ